MNISNVISQRKSQFFTGEVIKIIICAYFTPYNDQLQINFGYLQCHVIKRKTENK